MVQASYQLFNNGVADGSAVILGATGTIFQDGDLWTRSQFFGIAQGQPSASPSADSILTGTYGTLDINQAGTWTYSLNNASAATQGLAANEVKQDTFVAQVTDGQNAATTQTITINVTGTNDAPALNGAIAVSLNNEEHSFGSAAASSAPDLFAGRLWFQRDRSGQHDNGHCHHRGRHLARHVVLFHRQRSRLGSSGQCQGSSARLLAADASTRIYFDPASGFAGADPSAITFLAWDQSIGVNGGTADASVTGGTTAFSSTSDLASLSIVSASPFTLTTGVDTVFFANGTNTVNGTAATLNATDSLTGSGTDTLNLDLSGD